MPHSERCKQEAPEGYCIGDSCTFERQDAPELHDILFLPDEVANVPEVTVPKGYWCTWPADKDIPEGWQLVPSHRLPSGAPKQIHDLEQVFDHPIIVIEKV